MNSPDNFSINHNRVSGFAPTGQMFLKLYFDTPCMLLMRIEGKFVLKQRCTVVITASSVFCRS